MKPLLIDASFARDCSTDKISAFPLETRSMRLLYLTVYVPSSFFSLDIRPDALNKLGNNWYVTMQIRFMASIQLLVIKIILTFTKYRGSPKIWRIIITLKIFTNSIVILLLSNIKEIFWVKDLFQILSHLIPKEIFKFEKIITPRMQNSFHQIPPIIHPSISSYHLIQLTIFS